MAIGMTPEEFYDGPCSLTVAYRKAHKIRREQANFDAYLNGAYIYAALVRVAPALHAFSKNPKPEKYLEKPLDIYAKKPERDRSEKMDEKKQQVNQAVAYMQSFMAKHNANLAKKAAAEDGQGDSASE